jgi:perosamine synthetase
MEIPFVRCDRESAWHLYVIKLNEETLRIDRDLFGAKLRERGIETSVHFIPLYRHPYYKNTFGYNERDFPNAEWIHKRSLFGLISNSRRCSQTHEDPS